MSWPTGTDYSEAVQNPRQRLLDPELQAGRPELDKTGRLPRPISGRFGVVYQFHCGPRVWGVKFFTQDVADQKERYAAISASLNQKNLPHTVRCEYLPAGVRIRGQVYPVLKMEWAQGDPLHQYIKAHLSPPELAALAGEWQKMAAELGRHAIAHGDLQHDNVLVVNGALKLVDYDGMYVPALAGRKSAEIGQENYQHPRRDTGDFGPHIDHFSAWVIYVSLAALSIDPSLWRRVPEAGDEALLLRKADFEAPRASPAFALLSSHPDRRIRDLAGKLAAWCACASLDRIPALKDATPLAPPYQSPQPPPLAQARPVYTGGLSGPVPWPEPGAPGGAAPPPSQPSAPPAAWPAGPSALPVTCPNCRHLCASGDIVCPRCGELLTAVPARRPSATARSPSRVRPHSGFRFPKIPRWRKPNLRLERRWRAAWNRLRPRWLPSRRARVALGVAGLLGLFTLWSLGILPRDEAPAGGPCAALKPPPPGIAATPVTAAGGALRMDFRIAGILVCPARLRLDIAIVRTADRPLAWTSDEARRDLIYLESAQGRHLLRDMGGVFTADAELQPGLRYDGWLEFERPDGARFTLVYPGARPVPIDLDQY